MAHVVEKGSARSALIGRLIGKRPLGRPSCKYVGGVDWIRLIQDRHKFRALVVPEVTVGLPKIRGISRLFE